MLLEVLTGAVPFPHETEAAILYAHVNEPPPLISERRPELRTELDDVVARGLAKQPEDRYRTASGSSPTHGAHSPGPRKEAVTPLLGDDFRPSLLRRAPSVR